LGLPLGFGFLGASYAVSAFAHSYPTFSVNPLAWFQLLSRPFAFAFLAVTYYFSKKTSTNTRLIGDATFSGMIVVLTALFVLFIVAPKFALDDYQFLSIYTRVFDIVCLVYITVHTIRSHLVSQDSKTILTPFGYMLLGIGQYSLLIWNMGDMSNKFPFYGGLALRWIGLILFLIIAYRTFYGSKKRIPE
jgi:hypothetical protein